MKFYEIKSEQFQTIKKLAFDYMYLFTYKRQITNIDISLCENNLEYCQKSF